MTTQIDADRAEREQLASLPGLTEAQRKALRDPEHSLEMCRTLVRVLRVHAAAQLEAKPESERALARAFGQTQIASLPGVSNHGVTQTFGGSVEVPRG